MLDIIMQTLFVPTQPPNGTLLQENYDILGRLAWPGSSQVGTCNERCVGEHVIVRDWTQKKNPRPTFFLHLREDLLCT
jgi:hypothetical protein